MSGGAPIPPPPAPVSRDAHVPVLREAHIPVLRDEVVAALGLAPGAVAVDATLGGGGYARAFIAAGAIVHGFDRDPDVIAAARSWPEARSGAPGAAPKLIVHHRRFSEMVAALAAVGVHAVDAVAMDIGVSSMQLDQAERGFAFGQSGPLDMRMSREGLSAADFLNEAGEGEIADVLFQYGEERQSRRVARAIVAARPLATTGELAAVIRKALGYNPNLRGPRAQKDPAVRSFQAIRIHVNGELDELVAALAAAETLLRPGGRLAVVTFHSIEDRIVKQFLRAGAGAAAMSRHVPVAADGAAAAAPFTAVSRAIRPSEAEIAANPRARSATLRHATRTAAPPRGDPAGDGAGRGGGFGAGFTRGDGFGATATHGDRFAAAATRGDHCAAAGLRGDGFGAAHVRGGPLGATPGHHRRAS